MRRSLRSLWRITAISNASIRFKILREAANKRAPRDVRFFGSLPEDGGALAVEQPHACRLKPGLEALSNRAVQQRELAAAWAVGFGSLGRLGWPYLPLGVQPGMLVATHGMVKILCAG